MAGYIGKSQGVTQVDGYNRTEADGRYVNASGDTMTGDLIVDANVGIWTHSPTSLLSVGSTSTSSGDIALRTTKTAATITPSNSDAGGLDINVGWVSGGQGPLTFSISDSVKMRIDSAGRVTMPYQPAFNARGAVSQTYTTTGWKQIFYPNSVSQRGSAYNSATSTFTAPVSAWYYFSITANFLSNSDVDGAITISKNGGTTDAGITVMQAQNGGSYNGRSASGVVYLTANDYVNVWAYSTVDLTSRASTWAGHFSGYLIG